jgi:hypothetical protein
MEALIWYGKVTAICSPEKDINTRFIVALFA